MEQVEDTVDELTPARLLKLLQQLELRPAVVVHRNDLAINDRVVPEPTKGLHYGTKSSREVVAFSRVEADLPFFDFGDGPIAIPFDLELPAGPVERLLHQ